MPSALSDSQKPISSFVQSIDDKSIRMIMKYFRIEDYDCFVNFARNTGSDIRTAAAAENKDRQNG
ncbi:MAG TPA: hypothetical protein VJP79_04795 [Nitrososphaera sp.]|nr:hypothetical protein [Nitrososphaera sp.]